MLFFSHRKDDNGDLYSYQIDSKKTTYFGVDIAYLRQLNDGRNFLIDQQLKLHQLHPDGHRQYIHTFKHLSGNHWQVFDKYLYFTELKHGNSYIGQKDLEDDRLQVQPLAKNSDTWEFSLHPAGVRLLLIRYQTADSDLMKVTWPVP